MKQNKVSLPAFESKEGNASYFFKDPSAEGKCRPHQAVVCFACFFRRKGETITWNLTNEMHNELLEFRTSFANLVLINGANMSFREVSDAEG